MRNRPCKIADRKLYERIMVLVKQGYAIFEIEGFWQDAPDAAKETAVVLTYADGEVAIMVRLADHPTQEAACRTIVDAWDEMREKLIAMRESRGQTKQ